MELTVLAVPDCPNAPVLEHRLAVVLRGRPEVTVTRQLITDPADAAQWGMHGSPTLLVNGKDLFAPPDASPAIACRMYPGEDGRLEGAPTLTALRLGLEEADGPAGRRCRSPGQRPGAQPARADPCCSGP
jgi:hypothetical protein